MADLDPESKQILDAKLAQEAAIVIWLTSLFSRLGVNMSDQFLMHGRQGIQSAITNMDSELRDGLSERTLQAIIAVWILQLRIFGIDFNLSNKVATIRSMSMLQAETTALRHQLFISGTTSSQINRLLNDPEVSKLPVEAQAAAIKSKMNEPATKARAGMVAVGVVGEAGRIGQLGGAQDSERVIGAPEKLKDWIDVGDGRVRFTHTSVIGPIPINDKFQVGASLMDAPHDPAGSIEETANCRCVLKFSNKPQ